MLMDNGVATVILRRANKIDVDGMTHKSNSPGNSMDDTEKTGQP